MKPKNTSYLLIVILLVASFSLLAGDTSIALLIDPSNPDSNKVKIFQKTYMGMLDGDRGYGTFGPRTTAKWKEVVYDQKTYENMYQEAISLKDDSDFMNYCKDNPYDPKCPGMQEAIKEYNSLEEKINAGAIQKELEETKEAYNTVRAELNEVNLLNSKLCLTYGSNITNSNYISSVI